jgi:uncharacterized protein
MMPLPITSLTAALAAILLLILSFMVSAGRGKAKVNIGDGGDEMLIRRIRAQGNFVEYVPMALILIGLNETAGANATLLWVLSAALLAGRISFAHGINTGMMATRAGGMMLTYLVLLIASITLLIGWFG